MGYGRGNVGTGMHLIRGVPGRFRCAKKRLPKRDRDSHRAGVDLRNGNLEHVEEETSDKEANIFTGGGAFDCSENLAASIIAKLSGMAVEEICVDTAYEIRGVQNCICLVDKDEEHDSCGVLIPICYGKKDHIDLENPSVSVVIGDVDCDLFVDASDDPEINAMKMEWSGQRSLLSRITGLMNVQEINSDYDNVTIRPSPWLFEMMDEFQIWGLASRRDEMAARMFRADCNRLDVLVNIILDVTKSIHKCLKEEGCTIYNFADLPKGFRACNLPYDDGDATSGMKES